LTERLEELGVDPEERTCRLLGELSELRRPTLRTSSIAR
jgi:hypothetical protein